LIEDFPDERQTRHRRQRQMLDQDSAAGSSCSSMSKFDLIQKQLEQQENELTRVPSNDIQNLSESHSKVSGTTKYLHDLKSEMDRMYRNQKKLLKMQKKALRSLKDMQR
jgi:hypothetical protein